jgi:hypothetical protein
MIDAQELEKLLADVRPGEWRYRSGPSFHGKYHVVKAENGDLLVCECWDNDETTDEANARLIALAPTLARRVIAAEKLVAVLKRAQKIIDPCNPQRLHDWQKDAAAALTEWACGQR